MKRDIGMGHPLPNGLNGVLNVLVVDDEPDICLLLATALEAIGGYSVTTATGARSACEAIERAEAPFNGIFLDIQMPETSGIELCRILRNTPGYAETPIIMLTAMMERHYLREAFSEGANDYITKPFDLDLVQSRFKNERLKSHRRAIRRAEIETMPSSDQVALAMPTDARSLSDPFTFRGVPRCVDMDAFHTYIRQSRARFTAPLFIKTIKLGNIAELYSRLSDAELQALLRHVAQCISTATEPGRDIFTYCGQGVFFAARDSQGALTQTALDQALSATGPSWNIAGRLVPLDLILGPEEAYCLETETAPS
ncbi:response regulator [Roseibacterium sp. SDUM158016]|uniref:response regulator n=1 Tax=Roseicyclus sediminis TaxID=2980997 RepID=UPI0021D2FC56|nr:response regulator [Roseibacterium sp. SDUM158016]MCU4654306.1 response regulator [Roseibacterium sp. SDUM158016]